jgi:hypothetical protein
MFKFDDTQDLFRVQCLDARLQQHGIQASERRKFLQMNSIERINAARSDREVKVAVLTAQAERALDEIGMKPKHVTQIMAGSVKIDSKLVDAAIRAKCEKIAEEANEKKRMWTNKRTLAAHETTTVEQILDRDWPLHRRVRLKNTLAAAGIID